MKPQPLVLPNVQLGPLAEYVNAYTTLIQGRGYSFVSLQNQVQLIRRFSRWLQRRHSKIYALDEAMVQCCDSFTFPMLDNGYVYLAGTRLSLYRTATDWAMVIEVFGFSPRSGLPDTHIHTFASTLHNRDAPERYAKREAYDNYLANNPQNDSRFVYPIETGAWQDAENDELVAGDARETVVRGHGLPMPTLDEYRRLV